MPDQHEATLQLDPLSSLGGSLQSATASLSHLAGRAGSSLKAAAGKVGSAAYSGVYHAGYGVAFGVVFSGVFLVELLPENNVLRRGFEDGAEEGVDAANARAAARQAKHRTLIDAEEDLPLVDEAEAPVTVRKAAPRKKRVSAAK